MRILLVTENLGSGGAERQLVGLADLLKTAGHEAVVITWVDKIFHSDFLRKRSIEHIQLRPSGRLDRVRKLASLFRSRKPDAVISFLPMANETAALASLLAPVRRLIVSERSFTLNWGLRRKLTNLLYRRADYVVANSNNEAQNLRDHCPALVKKIVAIPNYVDTDKFVPSVSPIETPQTQKISIVGVGRVIPTKNLINLVKALAKVKADGLDFAFKWYGATFADTYLDMLRRSIDEQHLSDRVTLMGECHDVAAAYRQADFFCFPSRLEVYPNVLVEAMAAGLPIVCSRVCEHPHIVAEGKNGFLFNPDDIDEMAAAIIRMIRLDPDARRAMSEFNRTQVIDQNSTQSFVNSYLKLL